MSEGISDALWRDKLAGYLSSSLQHQQYGDNGEEGLPSARLDRLGATLAMRPRAPRSSPPRRGATSNSASHHAITAPPPNKLKWRQSVTESEMLDMRDRLVKLKQRNNELSKERETRTAVLHKLQRELEDKRRLIDEQATLAGLVQTSSAKHGKYARAVDIPTPNRKFEKAETILDLRIHNRNLKSKKLALKDMHEKLKRKHLALETGLPVSISQGEEAPTPAAYKEALLTESEGLQAQLVERRSRALERNKATAHRIAELHAKREELNDRLSDMRMQVSSLKAESRGLRDDKDRFQAKISVLLQRIKEQEAAKKTASSS